jgi:hypothetical protein
MTETFLPICLIRVPDKDDPPIIDFEKLRQKAARLTVYCNQNPTHSLTTAAERIMGSK